MSKSVKDVLKEIYGITRTIKEVDGDFSCSNNKLTSLEGSPQRVEGGFYCSYNNLTSLEGCPKEVRGNFSCYNNEKQFTEKEIMKLCNIDGQIYSGNFTAVDSPHNDDDYY